MFVWRPQTFLVLGLLCGGLVPIAVEADDPVPLSNETQRRIREDTADAPAQGLKVGFNAETKLLAALQSKCVVSWNRTPVHEALAALSRATSIPIEIDEQGWIDEGMNPDEVVTLELGESTALLALQQLCSQLYLGWTFEYGTIQVMSQSLANQHFSTRVYNISKLTKWLAQNGLDTLTDDEISFVAGRGGFGSDAADLPPERPGVIRRRVNRELLAERLIADFIVSNTSGHWETQDGEGGTINDWSQRLIVRHTLSVQFEVAGCLKSLERLMLGEGNPATMTFPSLADPVEEQAAVEAAFQKRITLRVNEAPLRTVVSDLAKQHGLRVRFDREQPIGEWIDAATPVSIQLTNVSLGLALQLVLEPASLEAFAHEGMLAIGEATRGCELLHRTTAYRVDQIPHAAHRRVLETLIQEQTSGKWEQEDGEGGSLSWLGPKILLVRHHPQIQREVAALLRELQSDLVEGKLVFESLDGPQSRDWELKLYKFDSADELQEFQAALSLVVRDPAQVTKAQKIGMQLAIEATPVGHDDIDRFLKQYRTEPKPKEAAPVSTTVEAKLDTAP